MKRGKRAAPLPVSFFERPADRVAADLLGALVVATVGGVRCAGRIVEAEAYLACDDAASHGWRNRRTPRNASMFAPAGTWYVYRSYGLHWCANLVTDPAGVASAVLLRALEPVEGLETMRGRRGGAPDRLLCAGPGRLAEALGITGALDGRPMPGSSVRVYPGDAPGEVLRTPRIGITRAADLPLRFVERGSRWLSHAAGPGRTTGRA